ncbi:hypothetical protein BCR34DRAFT_253317 [Clohesyomyces aquaticus]|uniref:Uncharacterized protein n=1 Tax=Clohesyomyces aquaticus TaxID=1231657 RepID=A0A1Y1ZUH2_9PLEO|nr:hypothetical protein BCR34DRAFT_253317 [Clohesyomyces aquaticus]
MLATVTDRPRSPAAGQAYFCRASSCNLSLCQYPRESASAPYLGRRQRNTRRRGTHNDSCALLSPPSAVRCRPASRLTEPSGDTERQRRLGSRHHVLSVLAGTRSAASRRRLSALERVPGSRRCVAEVFHARGQRADSFLRLSNHQTCCSNCCSVISSTSACVHVWHAWGAPVGEEAARADVLRPCGTGLRGQFRHRLDQALAHLSRSSRDAGSHRDAQRVADPLHLPQPHFADPELLPGRAPSVTGSRPAFPRIRLCPASHVQRI